MQDSGGGTGPLPSASTPWPPPLPTPPLDDISRVGAFQLAEGLPTARWADSAGQAGMASLPPPHPPPSSPSQLPVQMSELHRHEAAKTLPRQDGTAQSLLVTDLIPAKAGYPQPPGPLESLGLWSAWVGPLGSWAPPGCHTGEVGLCPSVLP